MQLVQSILSAAGEDRPGVLDEVTQFIFERGCNITDSRVVNLQGSFAMLLLISGEPQAEQRLRQDFSQFAQQAGLRSHFRTPRQTEETPDAQAYIFVATGRDQAGLLHKLSHLFRVLTVNIDDVDAQTQTHPVTHTVFFKMRLDLSVPEHVPIVKLREYLEQLCGDLGIEWELSPAFSPLKS